MEIEIMQGEQVERKAGEQGGTQRIQDQDM
jgi:hypothetical protein